MVLCLLPWLVLIDYWPPPLERPLVPQPQSLHLALCGDVGQQVSRPRDRELRPGQQFRGRIASTAGSDFEPEWTSAPLITQHNYDVVNLFLSGNDHRLYGLWYYDIPTLIELNQFSSLFFHLVNARPLNAPGIKDLRLYETQSIVNDRIMALLGVRYLLSNKLLPDRRPVLHHRLVEGHDLYVYSVPDPNLVGYSVTQTRRATDAQGAINLLADPFARSASSGGPDRGGGGADAGPGAPERPGGRARWLSDRSRHSGDIVAGPAAGIQPLPECGPDHVGTDPAAPASPQSGDGRNPIQRPGERHLEAALRPIVEQLSDQGLARGRCAASRGGAGVRRRSRPISDRRSCPMQ